MSLDRFELLELRREGSVQTYHAREISTARPVQVHIFVAGTGAENAELLGLVAQLPEAERRRVLDRGDSRGMPYIVTDRLAGYLDFREWVMMNSKPSSALESGRPASIDEQFFQLFDSAPPAFSASAATAAAPSFAPAEPVMSAPVSAPVMPGPAYRAPELRVEPTPRVEPSLLGASIEIEAMQPRRRFLPTAAKSLLWLVLGVLTAIAFLAGVAAFFAFRPH